MKRENLKKGKNYFQVSIGKNKENYKGRKSRLLCVHTHKVKMTINTTNLKLQEVL